MSVEEAEANYCLLLLKHIQKSLPYQRPVGLAIVSQTFQNKFKTEHIV